MARAFTINFSYHGKTFTAVISQIDGSVSIYIPDETLHSILPQGRVVYNPAQGIAVNTQQLTLAQDLIVTILGAIEEKNGEVPKEEGTSVNDSILNAPRE